MVGLFLGNAALLGQMVCDCLHSTVAQMRLVISMNESWEALPTSASNFSSTYPPGKHSYLFLMHWNPTMSVTNIFPISSPCRSVKNQLLWELSVGRIWDDFYSGVKNAFLWQTLCTSFLMWWKSIPEPHTTPLRSQEKLASILSLSALLNALSISWLQHTYLLTPSKWVAPSALHAVGSAMVPYLGHRASKAS